MAAVSGYLAPHATRLHPQSRAVRRGSVVTVVLDDDGMIMPMMATLDRAGHDSIRTMMSAAVVVEGNRAVFTVMKALTLVIDDLDVGVMVPMVGFDDYVSFGCRSYRRHRHEQR